jgi:hypothetical protein
MTILSCFNYFNPDLCISIYEEYSFFSIVWCLKLLLLKGFELFENFIGN